MTTPQGGQQINPETTTTLPPPNLRALLLALMRETMTDLNCCLPGTIQSYNSALQTASVSINLQRQVGATSVAYPLLTDVPVILLGGGGAYLSFPIAPGDTCAVFFSDRCIDSWWSSGSTGSVPASTRVHSLSDGLALVGLRSKPGALSGLSSNGPALMNTKQSSGIKVEALIGIFNATTSLLAVLNSCVSALTALNAKTGPDASTQINAFSQAIASLLE